MSVVEIEEAQSQLPEVVLTWARCADSRACCTAGSSNPTRMLMMAMTTRSSTKVKAPTWTHFRP